MADFMHDDFFSDEVVAKPTVTTNNEAKQEFKNNNPTWWRPAAMMRLVASPDDQLINFQFMLGEGKSPKENHYKKESKTSFAVSVEEAIAMIKAVEQAYAYLTQKKPFDSFQLVHQYNDETKTLFVRAWDKKPDVIFIGLHKGNDKYTITFNKDELLYFLFRLKLATYELVTGTKAGFTMEWI